MADLTSKAVQKLVWKGEQVQRTMQRAEARGAGWTIYQCVKHAKKNHPGWKSRSYRAQKSVRKIKLYRDPNGELVGKWGSTLFYVRFLEIHHGKFLQNAADIYYPKMAGKVREFFEEMS